MAEVARLADQAHLSALWLAEGGPGGIDPVPLAGSLAPLTTTLGIGIVARPSQGRHPSMLARDATTIDLLSGGRAAVALVEDGDEPLEVERLVEAASLLHLLLREEEVTVAGRFYEVAELTTRPRPVRAGGPPVVAGIVGSPAGRDRSSESVAIEASADAYVTAGSPADVREARTHLDGVSPAGGRPTLLWRGGLGVDPDTELVASLLEAGADGLIVVLDPHWAAGARLAGPAVRALIDALGRLADAG